MICPGSRSNGVGTRPNQLKSALLNAIRNIMKNNTLKRNIPTPRQPFWLNLLILGTYIAVACATACSASAQTLVQRWSDTTDANTRDIAYNPTTGNLLLVKTTPRLFRLNALTGALASPDLDVSIVSGGIIPFSGLAIDTDGVIYACNTVIAADTFKIYKWTSEAAVPTVLFSGPGTATGVLRQGHALSVYGTGNNAVFLVSGNGPPMVVYYSTTTSSWTSKVLSGNPTTSTTSGGTFIDYNASGFAGKFRILAKTAQNPAYLFSLDYPTDSSSGALGAVVSPYSAPVPLTGVTSGTHCIDYDPATGLLGSMTRLSATFTWSHSIMATKTGGGTILAPVLAQTKTPPAGTTTDSGNVGGATWGAGALFVSPSSSGGGAGIYAYDVTAFVVSGPVNAIGIVGDASATFTGAVFGGSQLTYQWKTNGVDLVNGTKYSGATSPALVVHNLTAADTGSYTLYVTGVSASTASASATLTVNNGPVGPKTWNGGSLTANNWSDAANWGGSGLNFGGDAVFFAGSTRLTPVMDSSYDVSALTFNSGASAFSISASGGSALTLSGGITNSSANDQTVNVPLTISATRTFNAAAGNVVLSGTISGLGGISKLGTQTLRLAGASANTFNGLAISQGNVAFAKAPGANAVGGSITLSTGTSLTLEASDQIADNYVLDLQTANATMSLASGVTETLAGFSVGGTTTRTNSGAVVLHAGAHLTIIPSVAAGNYSAVSILGDIGGSGNVGTKFIVDSAAPPTAELRWTPTNMVNTFEKLVIQNGGRLRCGHGGNAWLPQDTMLGAVPSSFMQDQITISNGWLGLNSSFVPYPIDATNTVVVNANRGMTILSNATIETFQNVVFPGKITGTGTLIHNGGADLALLGANDYTGDTQVGVGSLTLGNSGAAGTGTIKILSNTGALAVSAHGLTIPNHIDLSTALTNNFSTLYNDTNFTISGDVDLSNSGTSPQIKVPASTATVTFSGLLTNALGLIKGGAGKVVLTRNNTYSGATEVLEGTLVVDGAPTSIAAYTIDAVGTLGGTGIISGPITLNGTVSPGSSVGTLTTVDQTWNGGGHYKWEIDDANGTAGTSPGWDKLVINGPLTITASSGAKFTIDVAGTAANFNNGVPKSWIIASASGGISGFDAAAFDVNTSGLSNPLGGAYFTVSTSGNDLLLNLVVGTVGTGTGLIGNYYNAGTGASPTSIPDPATLTREDPTINFNWGLGSPDPLINIDHFIVRWTGYVQPMYSQDYTFIATTDDGVRLWVNGQQVINNWIDKTPTDTISSPAIALVGGQKYGLVMEYYEDAVGASAILSWSTPSRGREVIPQTQLYPASLPVQPAFTLSPDHTSMTISWSGTYSLRSATDLNGPWLPVTSSSPFIATIELSQPQVFYRLVSE